MMVRDSEWASFGVNLGGIAEARLLSHSGAKAFFHFPALARRENICHSNSKNGGKHHEKQSSHP